MDGWMDSNVNITQGGRWSWPARRERKKRTTGIVTYEAAINRLGQQGATTHGRGEAANEKERKGKRQR